MFDTVLRRRLAPGLSRAAGLLDRLGASPAQLTAAGLVLGLGAAAAAAAGWWWVALGLWLVSRIADGLDGALARLGRPTDAGGFVDLVADFTVYGAFVVGVAVQLPEARLAAAVLLCTYYVSGAAFLAWSGLAARRASAPPTGLEVGDERSVRFVGGLAEGSETIVAYSIVCLVPDRAEAVLWVFAAMVGVTAVQRVWFGWRHLDGPTRRS